MKNLKIKKIDLFRPNISEYLNYKILLVFALGVFILSSCDPTQIKKEELGTLPSQGQISIEMANGSDEFHYVFTAKSPVNGIAHWTFGFGDAVAGSANIADTVYYPLPGTYKIKLALYTRAGVLYDSTTVTTTNTDYAYFDSPAYTFLTGGIDNVSGKTWVLDSLHKGHLGVSAQGDMTPIWWAAGPLEKAACKIYDDKLIFKLNGLSVDYINHGYTYANGGVYQDLGGTAVSDGGTDFIVQYTPPTNLTWTISTTSDGKNYLNFANGGFVFFYTGAPFKYEILSIDENTMSLKQDVGWGAWFFKLIREGYTY